ncbi:MAG: hypothetical protein ACYTBZ_18705 [Planctomycetota bacterium]|jgi:Ca2+-binding RTX toxin-like protein
MKFSEVYAVKSLCPVSFRVLVIGILLVCLCGLPAWAQQYCTAPPTIPLTSPYGGTQICAVYSAQRGELTVTTTGNPHFNDTIRVSFVTIPAGSIFAGLPELPEVPATDPDGIPNSGDETPAIPGVPAAERLPDDAQDLLQVYDMLDTIELWEWFDDIPVYDVNPGSANYIFQNLINDLIAARTARDPDAAEAAYEALQEAVDGLPWSGDVDLIKVYGGFGYDIIDCRGLVGDEVPETELYGDSGDDRIYGGEGEDEIYGDSKVGGFGNDTIRGNNGSDKIFGGDGSDVLDGEDDDDDIDGGPGNDVVIGGRGSDKLTGGGGYDVADYFTSPGRVVVDFSVNPGTADDGFNPQGTDELGNNNSTTFSAIRGSMNPDALIAGNIGDDGTDILGGFGNDTLSGSSKPNLFFGEEGNDNLFGYARDDTGAPLGDNKDDADHLWGGTGKDSIRGGRGGDTICGDGDPAPNWPTVFDRLMVWPPLPDNDPALGFDLIGLPTTSTIPTTTNDLGGDDKIWGGDGGDTIYGGGGDDLINGGPQTIANDSQIDTIYGDFRYDLDFDWVLNVGMGDLNSRVGGSDRIYGGTSFDTLYGGAGSDIIVGGGDEDILFGGEGSDVMIGGECALDSQGWATSAALASHDNLPFFPTDVVDYSMDPAGVTVRLGDFAQASAGFATDGWGGFDMIYTVENIIGSEFGDTLTGSDDTLESMLGSFSLNHVHVLKTGMVYPSIIFGSFFGFFVGTYGDYVNIIIGLGGDDVIYGGRGEDYLDGGEGADTIYGDNVDTSGDDDVLIGHIGDDRLNGQGGDDVVVGGIGADILSGGIGFDALDYSEDGYYFLYVVGTSNVTVNLTNFSQGGLAPDTATDQFGDTDTIINGRVSNPGDRFESVFGTRYDDTIWGHNSASTMIDGNSGNDILTGGTAADVIYGGPGSDMINGGKALNNTNEPDSSLIFDALYGTYPGAPLGNYNDTVSYAASSSGVVVSLALGKQNTIGEGWDYLEGFSNITGSVLKDILTGDAGDNILRGGLGNDTLDGGQGNDTLIGGVVLGDGGNSGDQADYRYVDPSKLSYNWNPITGDGLVSNDGFGTHDTLNGLKGGVLDPENSLYVNVEPDKNIPPGGATTINVTVSGGYPPYTYLWNIEPPVYRAPGQAECDVEIPGLDDRCKAEPKASPESTSTYRLTATDVRGDSASDYVTVFVSTDLVVDAGPDRSVVFGQSVQLLGTASGGTTPYAIEWSPPDGLSSTNILSPRATPSTTTNYTLTVKDALGQQRSDSITVRVGDAFTVNAGADVAILAGESTRLNAVISGGTPPYEISWSPATGLSGTTNITNPDASPTITTTYTVMVTDAGGRTVVDSVTVNVSGIVGGTDAGTGQGTPQAGGDGPSPQSSSATDSAGEQPGLTIFPFCASGVGSGFMLISVLVLLVMKRRFGR